MILRKAPCTLALAAMLAVPTAALAQQPATPQQPSTTQKSAPEQQTTPAAIGAISFINKAEPGQYRAGKLIGVKIHNPKNETIGNVNDVLVDKKGAVIAVVIGVGGFLGIGEKNVALPYTAVTWTDTPPTPAQPDAGAQRPTGSPSSSPGAPQTQSVNQVQDYPAGGSLAMSKEQLEAAPAFKFASEAATQ